MQQRVLTLRDNTKKAISKGLFSQLLSCSSSEGDTSVTSGAKRCYGMQELPSAKRVYPASVSSSRCASHSECPPASVRSSCVCRKIAQFYIYWFTLQVTIGYRNKPRTLPSHPILKADRKVTWRCALVENALKTIKSANTSLVKCLTWFTKR